MSKTPNLTDTGHLEREQRAITALSPRLRALCNRVAADTGDLGLEPDEVAEVALELLTDGLDRVRACCSSRLAHAGALAGRLKLLCEDIALDVGLRPGEVRGLARELLAGTLKERDAWMPLAER